MTRIEIQKFRNWIRTQPESQLLQQYMPLSEQEKLTKILLDRYTKEKDPDKNVPSGSKI